MTQRDQSHSLPRERCPVCLRDVAVRKHGFLREHRHEDGAMCTGSGFTVDQLEERIERELRALREANR